MKKTLVKGLVALAAGALLAGGLLGCQQTVDSFTVKPSSLDSANVKAVHTPGFFALTWDRVKNCEGYRIEMEDQNGITDVTEEWTGNALIDFTQTYAIWKDRDGLIDPSYYLLEGQSKEVKFTVIAQSSSASGRVATTLGVQNSYSSTTVTFKPWADNTAKPTVPGDVKATLVYDPLSEGETTTGGWLSGSFTAKAGVMYGIVKDPSKISVNNNNVTADFVPLYGENNSILFALPYAKDTKVTFYAQVDDVTPGKKYSYYMVAYYNMGLYSVKELTVTPTVQEAYAEFNVASKTAGDTVTIGAEWNKAYGGSLEYVVLTAPVAYNPGMTAAEIYKALGTTTPVKVSEDNVATDRNVATFDVNRADKDTVTYVVVILKKDDTYQMRTVTVRPKATTPEQRCIGSVSFVKTNTSYEHVVGVNIQFLDDTDITTLSTTAVSYKVVWTAYKTLSDPAFNNYNTVRIPVETGATSLKWVKASDNELGEGEKKNYVFNDITLTGTDKHTMDKIEYALYVEDELVTWPNP